MELENLKEQPFYLDDQEIRKVRSIIESMTIEQKAGQLFCILGDVYAKEELKELVESYAVGGVLFRPDTKDNILEKFLYVDKYAAFPLLKAANLEEGGAGIITDGTYFGSAMQIAASDDLTCTEHFAAVCAMEGKSVGVNWSFSPVVDIDYNFMNPITNVRTFGSNPEYVLNHAKVYVRTLQKLGVAASCKHFPGDGVDYRDQHLHPSYNDLSAQEWYSTYGHIYEELIKQDLLSIMVGHIVQPNVIKDINSAADDTRMLPASQSEEMLNGVLRKKYGFNGVVITDATIMGGYCMTMERRKSIPFSIAAGCDMICFSTDIKEDIGFIMDGLKTGLLSEERLNEAISRILALKIKVNKNKPDIMTDSIGWKYDCADKAVTLVKDIQNLIPVTRAKNPEIRLIMIGTDEIGDGSLTEIAYEYLSEKGFEVEKYDPFQDDLHGTANLKKECLNLIIANIPTASNQTAARINWCPKHAMEIPRFLNEETYAFISMNNPYHLQDIPRVRTYINAYSPTKAAMHASLEKLLGISPFKGKSPVDAYCGLKDTYL